MPSVKITLSQDLHSRLVKGCSSLFKVEDEIKVCGEKDQEGKINICVGCIRYFRKEEFKESGR